MSERIYSTRQALKPAEDRMHTAPEDSIHMMTNLFFNVQYQLIFQIVHCNLEFLTK